MQEAGCILVTPFQRFLAAYFESDGDPCTTGCKGFQEGQCPAYRLFHTMSGAKHGNCGRCRQATHGLIMADWETNEGERKHTPLCFKCLAAVREPDY